MYTTYGAVATAQHIFFVISLFPTIFVLFSHGKRGVLGWAYFVIFCIFRIAGSSCLLYAREDIANLEQDQSRSAVTVDLKDTLESIKSSAILSIAGTCILVLAMQGLLNEIHTNAFPGKYRWFHYVFFTLHHISVIVALLLIVIGGAGGGTLQQRYRLLKVGSILLIHAYFAFCIHAIVMLFRIKHLARRGDRRLFYGFLLCMPFMFVRLVYSILIVFVKNERFAFILGNPLVFLGMPVLEEFVIMIVLIGFGI